MDTRNLGPSLVLSPTVSFSTLAGCRSPRLAALGLVALILATAATGMPIRGKAASVVAMTPIPADCGTGPSWPTKLGTDSQAAQVDLTSPPTPTTVAQLTNLPLPSPIVHRVRPTETTIYTMTARLSAIHTEHDRDLHLVVDDGSGHFMITELPDPACLPSTSPFYSGIGEARSQLAAWSGSPPATVQITGVGFFDSFSGQPDQAPNQIELHPILNLNLNPGSQIGSISGQVRSSAGGAVSNGTVSDSGGTRTSINSFGFYTLTGLAQGSHNLTASANGYTSGSQNASVTAGQTTTAINFNLAPAGLLRVTSSPALPTQLLLDGRIADSWGLSWLELVSGTHTECFTHVEGYTEPPCQTMTLTSGATTTVTGTFLQRGFVHVSSNPAVPSQITFDGNPTDDWGMFTDVSTGPHAVCFGKVANFDPPACQNITVTAGNLTNVTGNFVSHPGAPRQPGVGFMRIASNPAVPTQITIKAGAGTPYIADSWGLNWLELPPGSYTVSFAHVQGYTEPAPQAVTISADNTTVVSANFTQRGFLHVFTSPAVAATVFIDDIPRNDWGMWTDIPIGAHTVCFGPALTFVNTPGCQTVTLNPGVETDVTGTYS